MGQFQNVFISTCPQCKIKNSLEVVSAKCYFKGVLLQADGFAVRSARNIDTQNEVVCCSECAMEFNLDELIIKEIKNTNSFQKELKQINQWSESLYDANNRLKPEYQSISGFIKVIYEVSSEPYKIKYSISDLDLLKEIKNCIGWAFYEEGAIKAQYSAIKQEIMNIAKIIDEACDLN